MKQLARLLRRRRIDVEKISPGPMAQARNKSIHVRAKVTVRFVRLARPCHHGFSVSKGQKIARAIGSNRCPRRNLKFFTEPTPDGTARAGTFAEGTCVESIPTVKPFGVFAEQFLSRPIRDI